MGPENGGRYRTGHLLDRFEVLSQRVGEGQPLADQMAKRRLSEVQARGGGMVVTSCATCTFMLKRNAPDAVEVADLSTAVAQLTGTPYQPPAVPMAPSDDDY